MKDLGRTRGLQVSRNNSTISIGERNSKVEALPFRPPPCTPNTGYEEEERKGQGPYQVLRGAQPLEAVQGQQVSRVLVQELGGLFESALLAQVGSVPKRGFLVFPGVSLISPGLLPGAHGPLWKADRGVWESLSTSFLLPAPPVASAFLCLQTAALPLTGGSQQEEKKK